MNKSHGFLILISQDSSESSNSSRDRRKRKIAENSDVLVREKKKARDYVDPRAAVSYMLCPENLNKCKYPAC